VEPVEPELVLGDDSSVQPAMTMTMATPTVTM